VLPRELQCVLQSVLQVAKCLLMLASIRVFLCVVQCAWCSVCCKACCSSNLQHA